MRRGPRPENERSDEQVSRRQRRWVGYLAAACLLGGTVCVGAQAKASGQNLGVIGKTYPIAEEDMLTYIHQRLEQDQKEGWFARLRKLREAAVRRYINRPPPVVGVTPARHDRVFYFDPSVTAPYNVRNASGHIIIKKGTRVNPLDYEPFTEKLLFFDADNKAELQWAKKEIELNGVRAKPILTEGSLSAAEKALGVRIFFDQHGWLTSHFGIDHVPAVVSQDKERLKIHEIVVAEK